MWALTAVYEMHGWAACLLVVTGVVLGITIGRFSVIGAGRRRASRP